MKTRTRYAPSPTGFFHIGGARTALFNYLFAKHNNGDFILRIEDTDLARNVVGGIESQINNLEWMNLKIDESVKNPGKYGPYQQTHKLERYKQLAYQLLKEGKAYRCFCTKQELDEARAKSLQTGHTPKYNRHCLYLTNEEIQEKLNKKIPFTIRLKIPDGQNISWHDLIRGDISVPTSALTDPVILKSNGVPMYNFCVVVDDHDMNITHVLRGEEHISNTPYQICIKNALGWENDDITYGHLSVIVNEIGKKLSKRDNSLKQFIQDYREMGFLPQAMNNFLALLGWAPKQKTEILSLDDMIKLFDINHVSKSPAFFDYKKLLWMSNQYFILMNDKDYLNFVAKFINVDFGPFKHQQTDIILLFKKQISYAQQLNDLIRQNFLQNNLLSPETKDKLTNNLKWNKTIQCFQQQLQKTNDIISYDNAKLIIDNVKNITKNFGSDLFMPIRLVLTGLDHGPELYKIIAILGKNKILDKLQNI